MKKYRKLISIILSIAMIAIGFAYTPSKDIKAAIPDYPTDWTEVTTGGLSGTYAYSIYTSTLNGFTGTPLFERTDRDIMSIIGNPDSHMDTATLKVDDVVATAGANNFCFEKVQTVTRFNLDKLSDKTITFVEISGSAGTLEFFIKKGTPVAPTITSVTPISGVPGAVTATWSASGAPATQTYNIYLDGELFRTNIKKTSVTINNLPAGNHTLGVSGVWGEETEISSMSATIAENVLYSSDIDIQGFQIRSNYGTGVTPASVAYRTLCKAPNAGSTVTANGKTYTVKSFGTSYALDTNVSGDNSQNTIDASYTLLNSTPVTGHQWTYEGLPNRKISGQNGTFGYIATEEQGGIIHDWKESDTANTYYAFTMSGMDETACNTLFVRPFIVAEEGNTIIYGRETAYTSVAEIASKIYKGSMSKNETAHNYIYNSILNKNSVVPTTNAYHLNSPLEYGWNGNLYIGYRLVPDSYAGGTQDEMQYVKVGDYFVHASSYFTGMDDVPVVPGSSASYKGITSEELSVRVEQPGAPMWYQDFGKWYNWGIQIKYPNKIAYERLVDGQTYWLHVSYKASKAGNMWMKREGPAVPGGDGTTTPYNGGDDQPLCYPATAGYNNIDVKFVYHNSYKTIGNDPSIVFSLGGGLGKDSTGFPKGTIISDIDISFQHVE